MGLFKSKAPHNIVILRALQLGDLLCTVPSFRALRKAFPSARITLVGLPWAEHFVQRFHAYLDDFVVFPGWPGLPEREPQTEQIPGFLAEMQARQFDLALQLQGSGAVANPLILLFGARQSAGYYLPGQYRPNEKSFFPYPQGESEIRIFLRLMESLGIPAQGDQLEFPVSAEEQAAFQRFSQAHALEPGRYVCLHPGARAAGRRWTPDKFAAVGDALANQGYRVLITGTQAERDLTQAVAAAMQAPALDAAGQTDLSRQTTEINAAGQTDLSRQTTVINAAGQTDLGTLALLLAKARLLVSNDTGVSHIAAAFGTPSVILYTVSDPNRWRPHNHFLHRAILNADQTWPDQVLAEVNALLRETKTYAEQPL